MNARRWLITIVVCLLVFAGLAAYKTIQIRAAIAFGKSFPEPSETVEAEVVKTHSVRAEATTIGEIIAPQTIELRNELEGRVARVNFRSGDTVKRGDLLLQLDVSEETARLRAAQARAELAKLELQRIEKLIKNKTVSEEQLDRAKAEYDIALADIRALQAAIDKKTLTAPFDARTGIHQFETGEFLQSNTLITTLVGINDYLWVDFNLPLKNADVKIGAAVQVTLANRPGRALNGRIVAKDSVMSAASRNLRFRATLENSGNIPPNAIANITVSTGDARELPRIPITALRQDAMGQFVFVLKADPSANGYRAHRQSVTTGSGDDKSVTILEGINPGELIATQGAFKLRQNLLVFVKARDEVAVKKPAEAEH